MEEKKTIFDYLTQVCCIFAISMIILMIFSQLYDESLGVYSSMFRLGKEGLSIHTMVEFLVVSVTLVIIRFVFLTDTFFKKMSLVLRTSLMFITIIVVVVGFIVKFEWFPVNMWEPWAMFFLFFIVCSALGTFIATWKDGKENQRLEEGLARLKEKLEGKVEDE